MLLTSAIVSFLTASTALAKLPYIPPLMPKLPLPQGTGAALSSHRTASAAIDTWYYFDQLIDHEQPDLGTFRQRYYFTSEFYQPGGPIVLITPGESNADGYYVHLSNASIFGQIAIQSSGAMVMLEHRFYGESNPYPDLSIESFRVHTIQQAIDDFEYFAKHAVLPMTGGDNLGPDKAPWIVAGGSYSGALAAWAMQNKPGLFWAGYSSSGVVQAITDFWEYYTPIETYMDKNCSTDIHSVIAYVDQTIRGGNQTAITKLKETFGLGSFDNDDFANALSWDVMSWQSLQPRSGPETWFHSFCDALEVKNGVVAPPTGFGLQNALKSWSNFFQTQSVSNICDDLSIDVCLGTHNAQSTRFTDVEVDNWERSWMWIVCNEVGWLQSGPPSNTTPALVTRLTRPSPESNYNERVCNNFFPGAFGANNPPFSRVANTNAQYDGWSLQVNRLFSATGARDPWREATLSAQGAKLQSSAKMPIVMSQGYHCSDISTVNGQLDASVAAVQTTALKAMKGWLAEWKGN